MGSVVILAEIRAERLKAMLCWLARRKEAAIVQLREGPILAHRIFCRDRIAVLIDKFGYQTRLGYSEIVDATPAQSPVGKPGAEIVRRAGWRPASANNPSVALCPNNVIAFRRPDNASQA